MDSLQVIKSDFYCMRSLYLIPGVCGPWGGFNFPLSPLKKCHAIKIYVYVSTAQMYYYLFLTVIEYKINTDSKTANASHISTQIF